MTEDSEQLVKENNKENSKNSVSSTRVKNSSPNKSSNVSTNSQKKDKSRETQQTRVVIRHLPPTMTSEEFLEAISPISEHNDYYFCRSDTSLGAFGFCRAYINFIHMEDVFVFKDKFDGYVFVDTKGNEFVAIVEFSPFQRIPRRRFGGNGQPITAKKRDNKCGTIEQDPDYIQFLQDLELMKSEANMPSADVYLEEIEARDKRLRANHGCDKVSTPLIEFIKNRKLEKNRLREERREERKRQMAEQKRIREEEQQKKLKLLKSDDNKSSKDSEKSRDRPERSSKSEEDRLRHKRDSERKNRTPSKNSESKRTDAKKSEKKSYQNRSEKYRDSHKESKDKESTFVVKVVQNTDENKKSDTNTAEECDLKKSDNSKETSNEKNNNKSDEPKEEKSENSKNTNREEGSSRSDGKRIRNKDRPTREIYRPGTAKRPTDSAQSQTSGNSQSGSNKSERSSASAGYKQRVFTRSKH